MSSDWENLKETVSSSIDNGNYDEAVDALADLNKYIISGTFDYIRDKLAELLDKSPEHFVLALEKIDCSVLNMSQARLVLDYQDNFSDEIVDRVKTLKVLKAHVSYYNDGPSV